MSESDVSKCAEKLEANLRKEAALYAQLGQLARESKRAVEREDDAAFRELAERRNNIMTELRSVCEVTDGLRQEFGTYRGVPDAIRRSVSEALGQARDALEELLRVERTNAESFRAVKGSIQEELAAIARGRRLLKGYRTAGETEPLFMDKRQ